MAFHNTPNPTVSPDVDTTGDTEQHLAAGPRSRQVVVGVNKSEASARALEWAVGEARRRSAELMIVHAWSAAPGFGYPAGIIPRLDMSSRAAETLNRAVESARSLGRPATARLIEGLPVDVLIHVAERADLLVVGQSDHRLFPASVHRSTASLCARRARCPVVVVPAGATAGDERSTVGGGPTALAS